MLELKDIILEESSACRRQPVSFVVRPGDTYTFNSPSRSLNTCLLRVIMGLKAPVEGYVTIEGEHVSSRSSSTFRRLMTYLPHGLFLPHCRVSEFLLTLWSLQVNSDLELRRQQVRQQWSQLDVDISWWDAYADEVPWAVMRRILLAVSSMTGHPLVLLDMPFDGQSEEHVRLMDGYIRQMAQSGKSVLQTSLDRLPAGSSEKTIPESAPTVPSPGAKAPSDAPSSPSFQPLSLFDT
ncbi:MAG: hypothetical protein IJ196_06595 [Prevotella sp.]|nr:hypothetical protein [Prevotella sp.]